MRETVWGKICGGLSKKECDVLAGLAGDFTGPVRALEVGHYQGLSTAILMSSLPAGSSLVTVDHHKGDEWAPAVPLVDFQNNTNPYLGRVRLDVQPVDFRDMLHLDRPYEFVFYDACHTANSCLEFWAELHDSFDVGCVLAFDDWDFPGMKTMEDLALSRGFVIDDSIPTVRIQDDPQKNSKTYEDTMTIRVMRRS